MQYLLPVIVIFFAAFTQSLSGFGVALISMAFLPGLVGIHTATPLVAVVALTLECFLLWRYHADLNLRAVWPIALTSAFGIPLGAWALRGVDERIFLAVLGAVISAYALYALLEIRLPQLRHPIWAYAVGLLAGVIGGAYNTSGPPVIIYGNCRGWPPAEFKSNLQGFFLINSLFVVANHALLHNITPAVWQHYLWALPALGLGLWAGTRMDRYLDPQRFRKLVLALLVVMGVRLMF
ncbi:MAG: sulfite exporter TauE/SafE family protein [Chloroflexota bacterium]